MVGREPDHGPTARAVAANVNSLRTRQNLTYTQVANRLRDEGHWALTPVAIRRIEDGERRVTVDDLTALAAALRVSPATLLMPATAEHNVEVDLTGAEHPISAERAWGWLCASRPLEEVEDDPNPEIPTPFSFWMIMWPIWQTRRVMGSLDEGIKNLRPGEGFTLGVHTLDTRKSGDGDD
jgi:transcriptional regulator with XRE-family HTH domain